MSATKRFKREDSELKSEKTLTEMSVFKAKLNEYDEMLAKLEFSFNNPKDYIYDECGDLRRLIQLDTEETIAKIKTKHNFHIDTDESKLNDDLRSLIDKVKEQSDLMIASVDKYENETYILFDKNESNRKNLANELKKPRTISKHFVSHWKTCLARSDFEDNKMRDAARKLNEYKLRMNEMLKKFRLIVFSENILEVKEYEPKRMFHLSSHIFFDQKCHWVKSKEFNFESVLKLSTLNVFCSDSRKKQFLFVKLVDGSFLILYESKINL